MARDVGDQSGDFGWFEAWVWQRIALCLAFARGLSRERMVEGLGLRLQHVAEETFEEADAAADTGRPRVRVGERGGWGYAVEHFTQRGSDLQTLGRLSAMGGEALALTYTQTISSFVYWAGGAWVSGFDLTVPHIRWGSDPHRFDAQMERAGLLRPGVPEPASMGARFVQLAFGITIDREMLERPLLSVELP